MNSKTILYIGNELGSFRNHREHVLRAMQRHGYRPILVTAPVGEAAGIDYSYRPIAIERFRFAPVLDFRLFWTTLRLLLGERPAVAHFINLKPYLFGGLAAALARRLGWRGKVVITVPGLGRLYGEAETAGATARLRRTVVEWFLRTAARRASVTFETEHDQDVWIARGLIRPEQGTVTQGTGVDFDVFRPDQRKNDRPTLNVLFAGRLLRSKGLDVFLGAAALLRDPAIAMRVAGFVESDPDGLPLSQLRDNPDIHFLGEVRGMADLLRDTDIVVLPSRYREGVPRILIEAAACGCIPVATAFAGSLMLIEEGSSGFFLRSSDDPGMARELANLILSLKADGARRRKIGEAAAANVRRAGFGADEVAAAFIELYGAGNQATAVA